MNYFSENWQHLKSILSGFEPIEQRHDTYSFEEQCHAKALAIFLANASLATPILNRDIVEEILAGRYQWPRTSEDLFVGSDISLSEFEDLGLISFPIGWCATHCDPGIGLISADLRLVPIIEVINHLKDIQFGQNGCIKPHYTMPEVDFRQLISAEFGNHLDVEVLLPELELQNEIFTLPTGNQHFSSLVSTYLWLNLRRTKSPKDAFAYWMMCFRVNCDWVMPIIFEQLHYEEKEIFKTQLLSFLSEDSELKRDVDFCIRQSINETQFSLIVKPTTHHVDENLSDQHCRTTPIRQNERTKFLLSSLENRYPTKIHCSLNNLEFVVNIQRLSLHRDSACTLFYSWLLSSVINDDIRMVGQSLYSSNFIEHIMNLADSRAALKYILFVMLPRCERSNYMVWLLANAKTSDVAVYYLSKLTFDGTHSSRTSYVINLEDGYQQLVSQAYIRTIEKESDFANRLLCIFGLLGAKCNFRYSNFTKRFEYRFLFNFLQAIENTQVVKLALAYSELKIPTEDPQYEFSREHYKYLLGFWLIERLETTGLDPTGKYSQDLCESIQQFYSAEFSANLNGLRSLDATTFFATLPWRKLIVEEKANSLLALSNKCDEWKQKLAYSSPHAFCVASTVRQYLQVLMLLGKPSSLTSALHGVTARVMEIVRLCGFTPREDFVPLFDKIPMVEDFDLWEEFCTYSNAFREDLYEEFLNRCAQYIPLNNLFALQKKCTVIIRARRLQEFIDACQLETNDDLGLIGLEQAFTAACDSGQTETAFRLLESAKKILAQDCFNSTNNQMIIRKHKTWQSYEYKLQLLELYAAHKSDPVIFQKLADKVSIPHSRGGTMQSPDYAHYNECENFRRQLVAFTFADFDPEKSVQIMTALFQETKLANHGFGLFYLHLKLYDVEKNKTRLKNALAYFLDRTSDVDPKQMSEVWVATIMNAYRLLDAIEIDSFWMRLSEEQHSLLGILTPYCSALITRGDSFTARKVLASYQNLNKSTPDDLGIDDLISELTEVDASQPSLIDLIQVLNEGAQRSIVQLQKHYSEIVSKDFETYIEIIRPDQRPDEYLKDAILAIAKELTLRKRNLQRESTSANGDICYKLMHEDWINDWFTSFFDHRMSHAQIGFRDQKRGGQSVTGKNPGEIDGFITASDNTRVAIFEAFRLSSLDTSMISEHLNKIKGYDTESLSPVFVVVYCDTPHFPKLSASYQTHVSQLEYTGYTVAHAEFKNVVQLERTDHIWLGKEIRRRDCKDIVFYHVLVNLHFSTPL